MANYITDRQFTDFIHSNVALKQIYEPLGWTVKQFSPNFMNNVDMNNGVDYVAIDKNFNIYALQERFRDCKYYKYNDFTIRYKREYNKNQNRRYSEYFKLYADYFIYGIIDQNKEFVNNSAIFLKFAVIDVKKLYELIDNNFIIIDESLPGLFCKIIDNRLHCPVITNHDYSSSFVPFDIPMLISLFSDYNLVLYSNGF